MPNLGCTGHVSLQPVLGLAIGVGRAFVLPEMFRPGSDEKRLDEAVCLLEVPEHAPPVRAIPTPDAAVLRYRAEKFLHPIGVDAVLDRDKNGAAIGAASLLMIGAGQ